MSEAFSADWLALREPYDAAARSPALTARLAAWLADRQAPHIVDLGAGTGANRRFLGPHLGAEARWTLIERDRALVAAGRALGIDGSAYRECDLARDLPLLAGLGADLLAASALLDLVSEPWLGELVRLAALRPAALHLVLSYDGRIEWDPLESEDTNVTALVNAHQRTDKGFGPALGPQAVLALRRALADAPGELVIEPADWRLGPEDRAMQHVLLDGWLTVARSIAPDHAADLDDWAARRRQWLKAGRSRLTVGHLDALFLPLAGQATTAHQNV